MDAFGLHFGVEPRLSIYFASGAVAISSVALYHRHRNTANNQDLVFDGLPIWYTEQDVLTSRGDISLSVPEPTVTIKIATKTFQAVALQAHDAARRKLTTQKSDSQFNSIYNSSAPSLAALIVYPLLLLVAGMSMVLATLSHVVSAGNHRNIVLGPITKEQFAVLPSQTPSSFDKSQVAELITPNHLTQRHNREAKPHAPVPPSHGCSTLEALQFIEDFGGDDDDCYDWE